MLSLMCMYLYVDYALHVSFLFCFLLLKIRFFLPTCVMFEIECSDLMSLASLA